MQHSIFDELRDKWPSAIVARTEIANFTGGILTAGYMANLDSIGQGPPRISLGRKVAYPVDTLIEWLRARAV